MKLSEIDLVSQNLQTLVRTKLWAQLLVAAFLGVLAGVGLRNATFISPPHILAIANWAGLPGGIFLALIQMVVLPLIVSSIVLALGGISKQQFAKRLGMTTIVFVLATTVLAAFIGLGMTTLLRPGALLGLAGSEILPETGDLKFALTPESLIGLIPTNLTESVLQGNMLQVLIFSVIAGLGTGEMKESQRAVFNGVLESIQALSLRIIAFSMRIAPLAIFGIMLQSVTKAGFAVLSAMGSYLLCSSLGFACLFFVYGLIVKFALGRSPWQFYRQIREVQLLAFSLSSSAATMPTTLVVAKEKLQIDDEIAEFLIPLGTTINMAGSAIWQSTATLFIAQGFGVDLSWSSLLMVVSLTVGASIGTPGVPGAGMGVLAATFTAVGIPAKGISYLLGVDRLVDMGCTVLNVTGDLILCLIAQKVIQNKPLNETTLIAGK